MLLNKLESVSVLSGTLTDVPTNIFTCSSIRRLFHSEEVHRPFTLKVRFKTMFSLLSIQMHTEILGPEVF